MIDATDGTWGVLLSSQTSDLLRLSRDGRTLLAERAVLDADIWMLEWR